MIPGTNSDTDSVATVLYQSSSWVTLIDSGIDEEYRSNVL